MPAISAVSPPSSAHPNVAYAISPECHYKHGIDFINWMLLCMPLAICCCLYFTVMVKWLYPTTFPTMQRRNFYIDAELKAMGKLSRQEKRY